MDYSARSLCAGDPIEEGTMLRYALAFCVLFEGGAGRDQSALRRMDFWRRWPRPSCFAI